MSNKTYSRDIIISTLAAELYQGGPTGPTKVHAKLADSIIAALAAESLHIVKTGVRESTADPSLSHWPDGYAEIVAPGLAGPALTDMVAAAQAAGDDHEHTYNYSTEVCDTCGDKP